MNKKNDTDYPAGSYGMNHCRDDADALHYRIRITRTYGVMLKSGRV